MTNDTLHELRRRVADLERDAATAVLRDWVGVPEPGNGNYGVARLNEAMADTDTEVDIVGYTAIIGTQTPGEEPAEVGNPNELIGDTGAIVIVTLTGSTWVIAAVLEFGDAEHGFCRPYADFDDTATDIRPAGYQSVEGVDAPDDATESVSNDGFTATTNDTLAVAYRSGSWQVCYVIPGTEVIRKGRVSTATAATFAHDGDVETGGELEVWEVIPVADVADYDTAESYVAGNFVRESGTLYRCNLATADPAGAFDAGDWDAITPETDLRLIDRTQDTVTVKHSFHEAPPEGALVEWDSQGIRILTCDAPADWEPY